MQYTTLVVGELATNCYLLWDERSLQALIIDPGAEGTFISEEIIRLGLTPVGIVLTHGHFDHVLGLLEVSLNFPVPVWLHPADDFLLQRAASSAEHWLGHPVDPIPLTTSSLNNGQTFLIGKEPVIVHHVPGHTPGSIALSCATFLVTGDTREKNGPGSSNHHYSNRQDLKRSLGKIDHIGKGKWALPGHGEGFFLG